MQQVMEKNMNGINAPFLILKLFVLTLLLVNCGGVVPPPQPQLNPEVKSTSPSDAALDVFVSSKISVTFSEGIDPSSITDSTFFINEKDNPTAVPGTISKNGTTATFDPTPTGLKDATTYVATVTVGVQDLSGNSLLAVQTWEFTTITIPPGAPPGTGSDTDPPVVVSILPANGATNVSLSGDITVTFSEAIDRTTVTVGTPNDTDTFDIDKGAKGILGFPTGNVVTFTPKNLEDPLKSKLKLDTLYTVKIIGGLNGVKDLSGNALIENAASSSTFRTVEEPPDDDN